MQRTIILITAIVIFLFSGCAIIEAILGEGKIKEPIITVESVDFGKVSFESLELLFNIMIENPNKLGISLSAFDYELLLNDKSFIKGDQPEGMELEAQTKNDVRVPIALTFRDVIESVQSVEQQDSSHYLFKSGFSFALPVIGDIRIPVEKAGAVPVVKTPSVSVTGFKIENISFTGADALLILTLDNPNSFSFNVADMQYAFSVDGVNLLKGVSEGSIAVTRNGESRIEIPVSLQFADFGQTVYRILRGEQKAQFSLSGEAMFDSSLDFFRNIPLSFEQSGDLPLIR